MIPVLTPSEMAAADAAATEPVEVLIGRAGAAVAREALLMLGGGYGRRVVVLAGKGNNGADGRCAAERLRRRGARVEIVDALDSPSRLPGCDLVIDAAYGTGFHGEIDAPDAGGAPVLAVDIPSGVSGLTGEVGGRALRADRTVTFAALKPGLLIGPGRDLAGEVVVADIGLAVQSDACLVEASDVASWLPRRRTEAHKWDAAVLVVAGGPRMRGAAHLAAAAAQRAGAGMVRLAMPGVVDDPGQPTEAVGIALGVGGWHAALTDIDRVGAAVVGPGLGRRDETLVSVRELLASLDMPSVVDADALVALAGHASPNLRRRPGDAVLTPHDGEYARLVGEPPGADRLAAARHLAELSGSVALLKGSTTVIADPRGRVRIVTCGDPRLATAGTGDVLSGVIGALLAQGVPAFDAASAGAWLHGRAAHLGWARGLIASDLVDLLPEALAEVES
ncbi:MAG: NAD(P)H-hydrate dehydratase [Actinomycetota bacterium]